MEQIRSFFASLDYSILYVIISSLFAITFHETAHGYVAMLLGDPTAKRMGRLTLNPIKHIDVLGLLMMVFFRFGWAKPVPVDMRYFKKQKLGMALTALAGPVMNLLLAFAGLLIRTAAILLYLRTGRGMFLIDFSTVFASLNIGLAVFNLIPVPPLDGSKILFSLLPPAAYYFVLRYERYCGLLLVALLYTGVLDGFLTGARSALLNGLWAVASLPLKYLI